MARSSTGGPQLPLFDTSPALTAPDGQNSLFFALQPDTAATASIRSMTERLRGTYGLEGQLRLRVLHVTLAYLGGFSNVPQDRVDIAEEAARLLQCQSFRVRFDRVMTFPNPSRQASGQQQALVLCRDDDDRCVELDGLRARLVHELAHRGILETRSRAFRPHVTLLYDRQDLKLMEVEPITWTVRDFALLYSLSGKTTHRVLARYALH